MPKISAYDSNATLDFTEVVPIVQGGVTKKMALSQLTGRLFARAAGLWYPLAASAVAVSAGANTDENTLATIAIPAAAMGANGQLRITTVWTVTNSGNNKTLRVRLGGIAGTQFLSAAVTTVATVRNQLFLANRNSQSSQVGGINSTTSFGTSSSVLTTATVDTSAAVDLVITGQKASSGETLTLESYLVELLYAA